MRGEVSLLSNQQQTYLIPPHQTKMLLILKIQRYYKAPLLKKLWWGLHGYIQAYRRRKGHPFDVWASWWVSRSIEAGIHGKSIYEIAMQEKKNN